MSGVRERLFDSFKLEDNFPENHLLRRTDRFLDLSDLRQYLPDLCNPTCRPLRESEPMIRPRFADCCLAIRSDLRALRLKVAGRDESTHAAGVEGEALATSPPFRQTPRVASGSAASFARGRDRHARGQRTAAGTPIGDTRLPSLASTRRDCTALCTGRAWLSPPVIN